MKENYNPSFFENEAIKELKEQNSKLLKKVDRLELKLKSHKLDSKEIQQSDELEM